VARRAVRVQHDEHGPRLGLEQVLGQVPGGGRVEVEGWQAEAEAEATSRQGCSTRWPRWSATP
jgi:hypothetical protein